MAQRGRQAHKVLPCTNDETAKVQSDPGVRGLTWVWHESEIGICSTAVGYFSDLFQSSRLNQIEEIVSCLDNRVTHEDNMWLTAPVTDGEIHEASFQIPPTKAQVQMGSVFIKTTGRWWEMM